jgi:hypothetical protein
MIEYRDSVKDQTTTTGTGTVTLAGVTAAGHRTFAMAHTTGSVVSYRISNLDNTEWEVGTGTWTASGATLTRTNVLASSNSNALVNFSAGTKSVITTLTAGEFTKTSNAISVLKQKLLGRNQINPKVMTIPPVLTAEASGVPPASWTTPLTSALLVKCQPTTGTFDPRISLSTPELIYNTAPASSATFSDATGFNFVTIASAGIDSGNLQIRFCTDAPYFGMAFMSAPKVTIICDGELVQSTPFLSPVAVNARNYITVKHLTRKAREYVIYIDNTVSFGGLAIGQFDSVWAASKPDIKIIGDGDSYFSSSSNRFSFGFAGEIGHFLNADIALLTSSGSGYITAGSSVVMRSRISYLALAFGGKPDIVLINAGINDAIGTALNTELPLYYAALRAALPNALFIVMSPWCPTEANGASWTTGKTNPIFSAVRAAGGLYILIDAINGTYELSNGAVGSLGGTPWQTGTPIGGSISLGTISRSANTVSGTTSSAHGQVAGASIQIYGQGSFNGVFTLATASGSAFTYSQNGVNESGVSNQGGFGVGLTAGAGCGSMYAQDALHYNTDGVEYLSNKIISALAVAIRSF